VRKTLGARHIKNIMDIDSISEFCELLESFFIDKKKADIFVYTRRSSQGSILLKNNLNNGKLLVKFSNSSNPIGGVRIQKFIGNSLVFKGKPVDNFIYIAEGFKSNSVILAKVDKRLSLVSADLPKKEITIYGSMNIELNVLNYFIEFADSISFSISYDFQGLLKHTGFQQDQKKSIVEVKSRVESHRVFFSYSWDNETHKLWVLKLASALIKIGIEVLIDEWDLSRYNNDLHVFMENGIRESQNIILVCTPRYRQKANDRIGGVGVENTIITGEFYEGGKGLKYIPIVKDYGESLTECLPTYLKSKYAIDFNNPGDFKDRFDELVRKILNQPLYKKPELGEIPVLKSIEL
jgi:hypothetical protein